MRIHSMVKKDDAIYWEKVAVDDEGDAVYAEPIIIKCRWDMVQVDTQTDDVVTTQTDSNAVYPDRVLTVGGFLMLGNDEDLDDLTLEQRQNPKLCQNAQPISSQSTVFELGWEQSNVRPGFMSDHLVVEVSLS